MTASMFWSFGKYRELVVAIALFLVLDLGVLMFNVYTSHQIETDTTSINAGGELRMYSQQLTKSLLTLRNETLAEMPSQTSMAQIAESHKTFSDALARLKQYSGADAGDREAGRLLKKFEEYWQSMDEVVAPLLGTHTPSPEEVEMAATKFVARNVRLMQLADDLTRHLEGSAVARATALRTIQIVAILLALLNFVFIVVKFVRRLRDSDRAAEAAREETAKILATVHEGLFLVTRDGRVGRQSSASLAKLFGRAPRAGENFIEFLRTLVTPEQFEIVRQYLRLLFTDRIKATLMNQLNPLKEVEVAPSNTARHGRSYLSFEFEQVREAGKVSALLVTVFDVSERVRLSRALANAEQRARTEADVLLGIFGQDPRLLTVFVADTEDRLERINADLQAVRSDPRAYLELAERILRTVHAIKGEAMTLELEAVARESHACEELLVPLRARTDLAGDDFIPVVVALNAIGEQMTRVKSVLFRMRQFIDPDTGTDNAFTPMLRQIETLAQRVASDLNKQVRFESSVPALATLPPGVERLLREAVPQLVRNAVAHGIEPPEERLRTGKSAEGLVRLDVKIAGDGTLNLVVHDDGRGICANTLRRRLVETGYRRSDEVERMDDREIIATLLQNGGVSTADKVSAHAGRGVGLCAVSELVERVGAQLRVVTTPNAFTEFKLSLRA